MTDKNNNLIKGCVEIIPNFKEFGVTLFFKDSVALEDIVYENIKLSDTEFKAMLVGILDDREGNTVSSDDNDTVDNLRSNTCKPKVKYEDVPDVEAIERNHADEVKSLNERIRKLETYIADTCIGDKF